MCSDATARAFALRVRQSGGRAALAPSRKTGRAATTPPFGYFFFGIRSHRLPIRSITRAGARGPWRPSARTRALGAQAETDVQGIQPGDLRTIEWRGQPIFVLRRTPEMLASLADHDDALADPQSRRSIQPAFATNAARSRRPELLVLIGIGTHLGCVPTFRPNPGAADLGASWPGGFYCPCHGSKFDLAGRVFKNVPAPTNLVVPPYDFASASSLRVGADDKA